MLRNVLCGGGAETDCRLNGGSGVASGALLNCLSLCACVCVGAGFKVSGMARGREKPEPAASVRHVSRPGRVAGWCARYAARREGREVVLLESRIWALSASLGGRLREG